MATYHFPQVMPQTESIDVGSMFLMDLSVNESDQFRGSSNNNTTTATTNNSHRQANEDTLFAETTSTSSTNIRRDTSNNKVSSSSSSSIAYNRTNYISGGYSDYPSSSLDRLANAINSCASDDCDMDAPMSMTGTSYAAAATANNLATIIESRKNNRNQIILRSGNVAASNPTSSSLSDESYVANDSSSSQSTSSGDDSSSLSVSYAASAYIDEERVSTTTREDSGVLDMKDLDNNHHQSQYYNHQIDSNCENYDADCDDAAVCNNDDVANKHFGRIHNQRDGNNKQVLRTIMSLNLGQKPSSTSSSSSSSAAAATAAASANLAAATDACKPTDSNYCGQDTNQLFHQQFNYQPPPPQSAAVNNYNNSNYCDNDHRRRSRRPMSTSLPIQVPVRQLKRDLNKFKLNLADKNNFNEETATTNDGKTINDISDDGQRGIMNHARVAKRGPENGNVGDMDDDFLNQEYNENHQKHYSNDEFEENIRADENPMKVFESIQALAKSLHKDTEIFGSLPRKRL